MTIVPLSNLGNAGSTNVISGHIYYDYDNNGCSATDSPASYIPLFVQSGTNQFTAYANYDGSYTINVPQGNWTVSPQLQWNQPGFVINPASANFNFPTNSNLTGTQDFCISVATPITDVEVGVYYWNSLRPGFNSVFAIYYRNKGNQIVSGNVNFTFDATRVDFLSASPSGSISGGNATWAYTNLLPGEIRYIYPTIRTHSPTDNLPVNIGDILPFSVNIIPASDATPSDNSMSINGVVVGSYDPNNIICSEGNQLPTSEIGNYLHYTVNFENTGNYPADFVNVRIPIDTNLYDMSSLEIEGTSHNFQPKLQNNVLNVLFPHIMLDTGGHGNVLLKIKSKNSLQAGDTVSKRADIYFDYNTPIDTGLANTIYQSLASQIFDIDHSIMMFPNPAQDSITIKSNGNLQSIEVFDAQGRIIIQYIENSQTASINLSQHASGIYFVKIVTDSGAKIEKLIKK